MGKSLWVKRAALIAFVCCGIWLSTSIFTGSYRNIRSVDLLSFVPVGVSSLQPISWMSHSKSDRKFLPVDLAMSAGKNHLKSLNDSFPWLHYYASSPKILTNYFLHGYHQGFGKYHRKYRHSRIAIVPFLIDKDNELSNCLTRVSLRQSLAVSYHHSMLDRWHWENSNEGLAKFKGKYNVFYGHSSMGICSRSFLGSVTSGSEVEFGAFNKYSTGNSSGTNSAHANKNLKGNSIKQGQTGSDKKSDSMNCGQVLLLQHPVSRALEEYYKTVPRKAPCDGVPKNSVGPSEDHDNDDNLIDEDDINGEDKRIIRWIKTRGNIVFQHLIFDPELCNQSFFLNHSILNKSYINTHDKNQTKNNLNNDSFTNVNDTNENSNETGDSLFNDDADTIHYNMDNSCGRNMKLYLENLNADEQNFLVNYIIENLPSWFSLVGLYEDLQKSLQMLDLVHHFPLHSCLSHESEERVSVSGHSNSDSNRYRKNGKNTAKNSFAPKEQRMEKHQQDEKTSASQRFESLNKDLLPFESELSSNIVGINKISKTQEVFEDLKAESDTEDNMLLNNDTTDAVPDLQNKILRGGDERNKFDNNIIKNFQGNQNTRAFMEKSANIKLKSKVCNGVNDLQQLFHRLSNNADVQKFLALDLSIYRAVKRLYQYQKQIVFNTLKT